MLKNDYGRFMQSYELLPLLGISRGGHLPPEGFDPVEVQGIIFKCEPSMAPRYRNGRRVKSSKHRVFYLCKDCTRWIPFGRAGQHRKGRQHKINS
jgi:hypothetical protein